MDLHKEGENIQRACCPNRRHNEKTIKEGFQSVYNAKPLSLLPFSLLAKFRPSLRQKCARGEIFMNRNRKYLFSSGKYWGDAAIPKGIVAMPLICYNVVATLQLRVHCHSIVAMTPLLQYYHNVAIATIRLDIAAMGHCYNPLCALHQAKMPQCITTTLQP